MKKIKTKIQLQYDKSYTDLQFNVVQNRSCAYAGIHLIADFWHGKSIESEREIKDILTQAAKASNSLPLSISVHKFLPQGITGVVVLAESHISIHTWPEMDYVAVDVFTCGSHTDPLKAIDSLKKAFQPKKVEIHKVKRGQYNGKR